MFDRDNVENTIETALRNKLENYNPEPSHMPFHTRLLGKDRMAIYSFIHSLSTTFGTAIFEKVAEGIARGNFDDVRLQYTLSGEFSSDAQNAVTAIMNELTAGENSPNHIDEIERIRMGGRSGYLIRKRLRRADIYLSRGNTVFLIDLKTAKPNISGFEKHKQDMLEWTASILHQSPKRNVRTLVAIPYNPYEPNPYRRWTLRGMLQIENQLMVGEEFWNYLAGGENIYPLLLDCFERVGSRLRREIDDAFADIADRQYR